MNLLATRKTEQNRAAVDPWTVVHLASGLALGLMKVPGRWALVASVAYELSEQVVERQEWGKEFFEVHGPESLPNALVDSGIFMLGHWLGQRWNEQ